MSESTIVLFQLANLSLNLPSYFVVVHPVRFVLGLYCHIAYMKHYFNLYLEAICIKCVGCIIFAGMIPPRQFFSHTFPAGTHHLRPTHLLLACLSYPRSPSSGWRKLPSAGHGLCLLFVEALLFFSVPRVERDRNHTGDAAPATRVLQAAFTPRGPRVFFQAFKSIPKRNGKFSQNNTFQASWSQRIKSLKW